MTIMNLVPSSFQHALTYKTLSTSAPSRPLKRSGNFQAGMDPSKWRISKACQECRAKKIRCDGGDPCLRCKTRAVDCIYRTKARNRTRRVSPVPTQQRHEITVPDRPSKENPDDQDDQDDHGSQAFEHQSVAATHRASPSMLLQLYYGPSSNFSIVNFLDHQIEGTKPVTGSQKEVQEIGPGLDRFNMRRLYFGDLADSAASWRMTNDTAAMLVDRTLASRLLERYLATYWYTLPIWSKDEYRRQLARLYVPSEMLSSENPDSIIVLLAMAMGASMLEEEAVAQFLFQRAQRWSTRLDEMVNVQAVQIALLMISPLPRSLCLTEFSNTRPLAFPHRESETQFGLSHGGHRCPESRRRRPSQRRHRDCAILRRRPTAEDNRLEPLFLGNVRPSHLLRPPRPELTRISTGSQLALLQPRPSQFVSGV